MTDPYVMKPSEAASFGKTVARSPRRVDVVHSPTCAIAVSGLVKVGSSWVACTCGAVKNTSKSLATGAGMKP